MKKKMFEACAGDILKAVDAIFNALNNKKKILLCGNGGSAADSQHIATELVIRMNKPNRPAVPAIALTTDTSMLTAGGNDIGFENIFSRQIEALGQTGDILIAISTSGKSENINRAINEAKKRGLTVIGFLGKDGGASKNLVDVPIIIPSNDTQRIQEGHITLAHIICGIIEEEMFG
ncbi:MAG: D-sedoheptulose 7-phosphate isomerase [Bacteroidetes bacterium]|nr:D-sedoheptulose 7-phosphate isomerase [Bacteroidota bacterium]MBU1423773.1 D-sedoheptulose 7-phosphate isomerase [Bacteroidota bacterium]MBU2471905.1 D-sedoheptulose 7-phosphate isomerase [Bacteroidota bacterium]